MRSNDSNHPEKIAAGPRGRFPRSAGNADLSEFKEVNLLTTRPIRFRIPSSPLLSKVDRVWARCSGVQ